MNKYVDIKFDNDVIAVYTKGRENGWYQGEEKQRMLSDIAEDQHLDKDMFFIPGIIQGSDVCVVDKSMAGDGAVRSVSQYADAMVTDVKEMVLVLLLSDCPPVYLYDPEKSVIGLVHSGRKGTESNIAGKTLRVMNERFGCRISEVRAVIGPHICEKCYEVGCDVADTFASFFPEEIRPAVVKENNGKAVIDLVAAIKYQLVAAGVDSGSIRYSDECTYENLSMFSYRRGDGVKSNAAVMALYDRGGK